MQRLCWAVCALFSKVKLLLVMGLLVASVKAQALTIFACEPEWASLAKELAPHATIYSATTAYQDPHFVQARPSLIAQLRRADLFVCSGSELEIGWLPALQMRANNPKIQNGQLGAFYASEQVERLGVLAQVDRSMGDVHAMGNPHVHFSPHRVAHIATQLAERLAQIDPSQRAQYLANEQHFQARWQAHTEALAVKAAPLQGLPVVAYHTSFHYLFDWLAINQTGDLEPKPGLPPTSGHLAALVSQHQTEPYRLVIYSDYQDGKGAHWLSDKMNVPTVQLAYSVDESKPEQASLFTLYDGVVSQLLQAVGSQHD